MAFLNHFLLMFTEVAHQTRLYYSRFLWDWNRVTAFEKHTMSVNWLLNIRNLKSDPPLAEPDGVSGKLLVILLPCGQLPDSWHREILLEAANTSACTHVRARSPRGLAAAGASVRCSGWRGTSVHHKAKHNCIYKEVEAAGVKLQPLKCSY